MATLEEIRKRIQQQQQDKNADAVSHLSTDEKKRRLKKQIGNSEVMLEKHYSKMTATMAAERLA